MADEAGVVSAPIEVEESGTKSPTTTDLKRKLDDLEKPQQAAEGDDAKSTEPGDLPEEEAKVKSSGEVDVNSAPDAKKPRLEEEEDKKESDQAALENGHEIEKTEMPVEVETAETKTEEDVKIEDVENVNAAENVEAENPPVSTEVAVEGDEVKDVSVEKTEAENAEIEGNNEQNASDETVKTEAFQRPAGDLPEAEPETEHTTRRMEVPNNKVGVLIGKSGDTIRFLQMNSGAKIQITRDAEADSYSTTRPVELIGTLDSVNKAERLIKDVIAEADAGGSPSLVARGFGTVQASGVAEQIHIQVPNEKVGMIIGKGGETIKNLQTRSGARIQVLIPQHLPEGDQSKERTVRVTGDKKQIDVAKEMIKEAMSQPVRSHSGGYNQQGYRPRGGQSHWGSRAPHAAQGRGYDNQHRGMYQSQNQQYMSPAYGGYPPQQSRSNFNAGWDQRPGSMHTPPQSGYDHYQHGSNVSDSSAPTSMSSGPGPASSHGAPPSHVNYNSYGQPQGPGYGQPAYSQSAPQQNYGHGYDDPKYSNQGQPQPAYGGHGNAQPGAYPQQVAPQQGYAQQPYSKPQQYGMPSQGPPQSYGPPNTGQPGDVSYQNPAYGQGLPSQQQYPYAPGGPAHPTYPYNSAPAVNDGYNQPPTQAAPAPVYPQPGGQPVPGYVQPGGQVGPGYAQGVQPGGYGPYSSQPGYGEQSAPNSAGYGYQGPDGGYVGAPAQAYGAQPTTGQTNFVQPVTNQPTYEQPAPQPGAYAGVPGSAPGYVKNLSPQPGYGQYDSTQMYAGQH